MAEKGIGALVVAEGEQVVGILSERDYTRKVTLMERSSYSTTVAEIMTAKVITVGLNNTVEECLQLMTDRHLRHLPVLDNGKLVGFISIGDLVKAAMEDQKVLIEQLKAIYFRLNTKIKWAINAHFYCFKLKDNS